MPKEAIWQHISSQETPSTSEEADLRVPGKISADCSLKCFLLHCTNGLTGTKRQNHIPHVWCNMLAVSHITENANTGKVGITIQGQVWHLSCPKSCLSERPAPDVFKVNGKTACSNIACCTYRYLSHNVQAQHINYLDGSISQEMHQEGSSFN